MKKIFLTFALLLTISFAFATNGVEKTLTFEVEEVLSVEFTETDFAIESSTQVNATINEKSILETTTVTDCWAEADASETAYCGSVGCNTSYWLGYMAACENAQE